MGIGYVKGSCFILDTVQIRPICCERFWKELIDSLAGKANKLQKRETSCFIQMTRIKRIRSSFNLPVRAMFHLHFFAPFCLARIGHWRFGLNTNHSRPSPFAPTDVQVPHPYTLRCLTRGTCRALIIIICTRKAGCSVFWGVKNKKDWEGMLIVIFFLYLCAKKSFPCTRTTEKNSCSRLPSSSLSQNSLTECPLVT